MNNQTPAEVTKFRMNHFYLIEDFQVFTVPLQGRGYSVNDDGNKYIFVNSKLPKAERTEVAKWLIEKRKMESKTKH